MKCGESQAAYLLTLLPEYARKIIHYDDNHVKRGENHNESTLVSQRFENGAYSLQHTLHS